MTLHRQRYEMSLPWSGSDIVKAKAAYERAGIRGLRTEFPYRSDGSLCGLVQRCGFKKPVKGMRCTDWTEKELAILKKFFPKFGPDEASKRTGRTPKAVAQKAKILEIKHEPGADGEPVFRDDNLAIIQTVVSASKCKPLEVNAVRSVFELAEAL